jgi:hypothetical protein
MIDDTVAAPDLSTRDNHQLFDRRFRGLKLSHEGVAPTRAMRAPLGLCIQVEVTQARYCCSECSVKLHQVRYPPHKAIEKC